jgi:diadenosine tetraphosphate (Ap4A) HIT family hydrolase
LEAQPIHPQLLTDCHYLGELPRSALLLHRNAALPWFILVPHTETPDLLDLPGDVLHAVMAECALVSRYIKRDLGYAKVNFAGLGNVVPQLHLHLIGRSERDPCWPRPVWGNLPAGGGYSESRLREWQTSLVRCAGLVPAESCP